MHTARNGDLLRAALRPERQFGRIGGEFHGIGFGGVPAAGAEGQGGKERKDGFEAQHYFLMG